MKTFVSITLAFVAIGGIVLITPAIAQTVDTQENAAGRRPVPAGPPRRPSPAVTAANECAPDDRKCEVERKLGLVNDPLRPPHLPPPQPLDPRKGRGF